MPDLHARLAALLPTFQARGAKLDAEAAFPAANLADLAGAGALTAPLPPADGGQGLGTTPAGARGLLQALRLIGQGSLATGRLYEGHVNAIKLAALYGTPDHLARVAEDAQAGRLYGLWVTDDATGLRLQGGVLEGGKAFCSGAGHLSRAVVTVQTPDGAPVLALVALDGHARASHARVRLQGMRAAATGAMDLTGLPADLMGRPGDYLRQPAFSAGAWRTSAVTLGGIDALVAASQAELAARGRADNPHQQARMGEMLIAQETAALWLAKAAVLAEAEDADPGLVAAYVNLARIAVEGCALDAIRLAQRSLGLAAFAAGHPAELVMRDLATYLRQPAPDETLTEAAAWFATHGLPA